MRDASRKVSGIKDLLGMVLQGSHPRVPLLHRGYQRLPPVPVGKVAPCIMGLLPHSSYHHFIRRKGFPLKNFACPRDQLSITNNLKITEDSILIHMVILNSVTQVSSCNDVGTRTS